MEGDRQCGGGATADAWDWVQRHTKDKRKEGRLRNVTPKKKEGEPVRSNTSYNEGKRGVTGRREETGGGGKVFPCSKEGEKKGPNNNDYCQELEKRNREIRQRQPRSKEGRKRKPGREKHVTCVGSASHRGCSKEKTEKAKGREHSLGEGLRQRNIETQNQN